MAKFYIYKTIAKSEQDRKGSTTYCSICKKEYKDRTTSSLHGVVCPLCAMGKSDGLEIEKPKRQKKIRMKPNQKKENKK